MKWKELISFSEATERLEATQNIMKSAKHVKLESAVYTYSFNGGL